MVVGARILKWTTVGDLAEFSTIIVEGGGTGVLSEPTNDAGGSSQFLSDDLNCTAYGSARGFINALGAGGGGGGGINAVGNSSAGTVGGTGGDPNFTALRRWRGRQRWREWRPGGFRYLVVVVAQEAADRVVTASTPMDGGSSMGRWWWWRCRRYIRGRHRRAPKYGGDWRATVRSSGAGQTIGSHLPAVALVGGAAKRNLRMRVATGMVIVPVYSRPGPAKPVVYYRYRTVDGSIVWQEIVDRLVSGGALDRR
ncbi:MAG: hypothetical protein MZW92_31910 [Comamonadaceae bacterium]|nr:hypothetical protein [Comamonadaceae bacterium]